MYPIGAQVEFDLRHNGRDTGEIRIDRIEMKLDDYAKEAACPFTLTATESSAPDGRAIGESW